MSYYVNLAKLAVESFVKEKKIIEPPENLSKELLGEKSGVFVTIERQGKLRDSPRDEQERILRGCIGTYLPTKENIAKEIIQNAIAAATEDYRFGAIQEQELPYLSYTVCILGKPELTKDMSELNPQKFGIIVKTAPISYSSQKDVVFNGHLSQKSGLLLPDLEGVDTAKQQISIACQKAGIDPEKEKIIIYKFTVEKHAR